MKITKDGKKGKKKKKVKEIILLEKKHRLKPKTLQCI